MAKMKFVLLFAILETVLILPGSQSLAEEIPFGINNPYDQSAPKEKAYLIKPAMNDLGLKWVNANVFRRKVEPRPGVYDWKGPDFLVKDIFKDLGLVFNINPKTDWSAGGSINVGKRQYIPGGDIDSESFKLYKTFVKELVKRYKDKVHRWEIFNEPGLECKDMPEGFVRILKISYLTIKEVDPSATVGLGGLMLAPLSINFLRSALPLLSSEHPIFGKENARYNNYFDSFDLHYFGFYNEYRQNHAKRRKIVSVDEFLNVFKNYNLFKGKLITSRAGATYTGGDSKTKYKGDSLEFQSETQQAGYLFRRSTYLLSKNIRFAWSQVQERDKWQGRENDFNCYLGLVYNGVPKGDKYDKGYGVKKLSYWTYKFLVAKIGVTDWKNISILHDGTGSDHLYLYKIIKKNGQPMYIAWWDYFDEKARPQMKPITIDVGNVGSVKITETIPNAEWGADLRGEDYPNFFESEVKGVSNGKVSIYLKEKPVFVEIEERTDFTK
jgi:hypothetical protein